VTGPASYASHPGLAWLRDRDAGRAWLADLPGLVECCARQWGLTLDEPFPYAFASLALPAVTAGGAPVVLKMQFPHEESALEGEALRRWNGDGAIKLLDEDGSRRALLLERCVPGTSLAGCAPDDALDVILGLLPRLWLPVGPPFRSASDEAARWSASLAHRWEAGGRRFSERVLELALELLSTLPGTQSEQVLIHQDLHGDNILRSEREPWLVIDPKPLAGERELGLAPLVRSVELGAGRQQMERRLERLVGELGLDRGRVVGWTLAQTVAWDASRGGHPEHVEMVGWLCELYEELR
jgi:streptomycin 6-kinase